MIQGFIGQKKEQVQKFLENGKRIPVTEIATPGTPVVQVKTIEKDGYTALQLAFGSRKNGTQAIKGHVKGANLQNAPRFLREIRLENEENLPVVGDTLKVIDVFKPGDVVDVTGISKGKGFAGVVKRHHFKGGPRTHGQSDRERAPGSIGQTTTPGRVYKGKRMAGHMGHERVTVRNLQVVAVTDTTVLIKGLVPGAVNTLLIITKKGEDKKFTPLYKKPEPVAEEPVEKPQEAVSQEEIVTPAEEPKETRETTTNREKKAEEIIEVTPKPKKEKKKVKEEANAESSKE